jgi:hypothetical protein
MLRGPSEHESAPMNLEPTYILPYVALVAAVSEE